MRIEPDFIECDAGWQAEIAMPYGWILHSTVYQTKERCIQEVHRLANKFGWIFDEQE